MDSLSNALNHLNQNQDTLLARMDHISQAVSNNSGNVYLPLISAAVGALIALLGQYFFKRFDADQSVRLETRSYKNKSITNINLLKFYLSELAYLKVDMALQYSLSQTELTAEDKRQASIEHYNDYKYISDCKKNIAQYVSELNSNTTCYYEVQKKVAPETVTNALTELTNKIINAPSFPYYKKGDPVTDSIVNSDIARLKAEYSAYLTTFETALKPNM